MLCAVDLSLVFASVTSAKCARLAVALCASGLTAAAIKVDTRLASTSSLDAQTIVSMSCSSLWQRLAMYAFGASLMGATNQL